MNPKPPYAVTGADRAGETWLVGLFYEPLTALWVLDVQRYKHPDAVFGVHQHNDPEDGDITLELEEMLESEAEVAALCRKTLDAYYAQQVEQGERFSVPAPLPLSVPKEIKREED